MHMTFIAQINDTALLVMLTFGTTLLAWRYLFEEKEDANAQVALSIYFFAVMVFFTTSLILIWTH